MCAGIVSVAKPLSIECQMANYSNNLYQQLEEETGVKTGQPLSNFSFQSNHSYQSLGQNLTRKKKLKYSDYPSL